MNDLTTISVVSMLGWLVLAIVSFASFRLSWGKTMQLALVWLAIFGGLFVVILVLGLEL